MIDRVDNGGGMAKDLSSVVEISLYPTPPPGPCPTGETSACLHSPPPKAGGWARLSSGSLPSGASWFHRVRNRIPQLPSHPRLLLLAVGQLLSRAQQALLSAGHRQSQEDWELEFQRSAHLSSSPE